MSDCGKREIQQGGLPDRNQHSQNSHIWHLAATFIKLGRTAKSEGVRERERESKRESATRPITRRLSGGSENCWWLELFCFSGTELTPFSRRPRRLWPNRRAVDKQKSADKYDSGSPVSWAAPTVSRWQRQIAAIDPMRRRRKTTCYGDTRVTVWNSWMAFSGRVCAGRGAGAAENLGVEAGATRCWSASRLAFIHICGHIWCDPVATELPAARTGSASPEKSSMSCNRRPMPGLVRESERVKGGPTCRVWPAGALNQCAPICIARTWPAHKLGRIHCVKRRPGSCAVNPVGQRRRSGRAPVSPGLGGAPFMTAKEVR